MKREIKFRMWSGILEYMFYPDPLQRNLWQIPSCENGILQNQELSRIDPSNELMEYIGIKDSNGKDVYENDIVKGRYMVQRSLDPNAEPAIIHFEGVISFAEGCFYVKADNGQCAFSFTYPDYELEVVGNEFEGIAYDYI